MDYKDEENKTQQMGETNAEPISEVTIEETGGPQEEKAIYEPPIIVKQQKSKKKRGRKIVAGILIVLLAFSAGFGGGLVAVSMANLNHSGNGQTIVIKTDGTVNTATAVAAKVRPSVVGISTEAVATYNTFWGQQEQIRTGVGTGVIVDEKGYILTNSHVINDGNANAITVQLSDGREVAGETLWFEESLDLAIVKIEADGLVVAELGDSDETNIGDYAVAIGNPLGLSLERTVTQGVISGLNRSIQISSTQTIDGLMQTDASINSGNSGGPLLNAEGQVIGINTAKVQTGEGLGFAIPINTAKPIVDEIKRTGEFRRAYIGIQGVNVSRWLESTQSSNLGTETGVYVYEVNKDSPALSAGLKQGDVIIALNDVEIKDMTQLTKVLYTLRPGDEATLTVLRNKKSVELRITLVELSE